MEQEKDLQVIFLKDLLFAALYQWRRILAAALIFAIALGCVAVFSSTESVTDAAVQEAFDSYESQKALLNQKLAQNQILIDKQEAYNTESIFMQLDPYNLYVASAQIAVQTDFEIMPGMTYQNPDDTNAILRAYALTLSNDQTIKAIADTLSLKTKYLSEILTIESESNSTRVLNIKVTYPTADGAKQILDLLLESANAATAHIISSVGEHSASIVSKSVNERIDLTVMEKQTTAVTRLEALYLSSSEIQAQIDELQAPAMEKDSISIKKIVLYAIVGAILGAGLVACFIWVDHIMGIRVYSARTLKNRTFIKVLSCIPVWKKKSAIDVWLRKLEGRNIAENQTEFAAAAIRNCCKKNKKLLIVGYNSIAQELSKNLSESGMQVTICNNLLKDAASLDSVMDCDAVVLLEQCNQSKYANITRAMELISNQDKEILGCVLLNG